MILSLWTDCSSMKRMNWNIRYRQISFVLAKRLKSFVQSSGKSLFASWTHYLHIYLYPPFRLLRCDLQAPPRFILDYAGRLTNHLSRYICPGLSFVSCGTNVSAIPKILAACDLCCLSSTTTMDHDIYSSV